MIAFTIALRNVSGGRTERIRRYRTSVQGPNRHHRDLIAKVAALVRMAEFLASLRHFERTLPY
jgi:hypothetical protein